MSAPVHVVVDDAGAEVIEAMLAASGWSVQRSLHDPPTGARVVCRGVVRDLADAAAAVLRVVEGHGLVIALDAPEAVVAPLLDDLRHLGAVVFHEPGAPDAATPPVLDDDQRRLVRLLAGGATLARAAHDAGLSRRTATRRLAALRAAFGVDTNAEAVVRARRVLGDE